MKKDIYKVLEKVKFLNEYKFTLEQFNKLLLIFSCDGYEEISFSIYDEDTIQVLGYTPYESPFIDYISFDEFLDKVNDVINKIINI